MFFFGPKVQHMSVDELSQALKTGSPVLIDVRELSEFSAGHVPGALNLPLGGLPGSASRFDRERELILICRSGGRSVTAAKRLMKAGYSDVRSVRGGTTAWTGKLKR